MINTAWISLTNGQKLSEIWDYMVKQSTGSKQSRVVLVKQSLKLSSAVLGTDTKPMCSGIEKLLDFATLNQFFSPSWD
jgi:hypothetical protein